MEISEETLKRVAEVSRLKLSPEEAESFKKELGQILSYFSKIQKFGEGSARHYGRDLKNPLRKDEVIESGKEAVEGISANFGKKDGKFLAAPKSLD